MSTLTLLSQSTNPFVTWCASLKLYIYTIFTLLVIVQHHWLSPFFKLLLQKNSFILHPGNYYKDCAIGSGMRPCTKSVHKPSFIPYKNFYTGIIIVWSKRIHYCVFYLGPFSSLTCNAKTKIKIGIGRIRNNDIGCWNSLSYHLGYACHPHIKIAKYRQFECGQKFCAPANVHDNGQWYKNSCLKLVFVVE